MEKQDEMQLVADSLAPEDFGIGQLFWAIRDAVVVGDAETGRIVLWNPQGGGPIRDSSSRGVGTVD